MVASLRWTSADLALLQHDDKRYEIIEGELFVSTQPSWDHQEVGLRIGAALLSWSDQSGAGRVTQSPGIIFAEDNDVAPDVAWTSTERFAGALDAAGHLRVAPNLVVEILSPGPSNEQRDRDAKLKLYSRQAVDEYWIVDPKHHLLDVYRRRDAALRHIVTLQREDLLESPLLPGFRAPLSRIFRQA